MPCEQGLGRMMAGERGRPERWFPVVLDRAAQSRRPEGLGREGKRLSGRETLSEWWGDWASPRKREEPRERHRVERSRDEEEFQG